MKKIFCSTGALIGRPNGRNYRLLKDFSNQLACDGFEYLVYDTWYPEIDEMIEIVKSYNLNIPVVHCEKELVEKLAGAKVWYDSEGYHFAKMTPEEDAENCEKAYEEFKMNLRIAKEFGAEKMVFHLWNGLVSDSNIECNIERFGQIKKMAEDAGILLMVENVVCNINDPMKNMGLVHEKYPDVSFIYDTKMSEFHGQTMKIFDPEWEWLLKGGYVKHLHINDYNGGIKEWSNLKVLPIGMGHVDFDSFFSCLNMYGYSGDYSVEATAFDQSGVVDIKLLNNCFDRLRRY